MCVVLMLCGCLRFAHSLWAWVSLWDECLLMCVCGSNAVCVGVSGAHSLWVKRGGGGSGSLCGSHGHSTKPWAKYSCFLRYLLTSDRKHIRKTESLADG